MDLLLRTGGLAEKLAPQPSLEMKRFLPSDRS